MQAAEDCGTEADALNDLVSKRRDDANTKVKIRRETEMSEAGAEDSEAQPSRRQVPSFAAGSDDAHASRHRRRCGGYAAPSAPSGRWQR